MIPRFVGLIAGILVGACVGRGPAGSTSGATSAGSTGSTAAADPCTRALADFAAGELRKFRGLPIHCTRAHAAAVFSGGGDPPGSGMLSGRRLGFRSYRSPRQREEITAWFEADGRLILLTVDAPRLGDAASTLLASLGPPERTIPRGTGFHADADQWVYASRGLTLYVRDVEPRIARAAAYAPTDADHYEEALGGRDRTERLP